MTVPAKDKSYQFDVNNQILAQGTDLATNRLYLRTLVNKLIGLSPGGWTCVGSSNSTDGYAVDGYAHASLWTNDSKLVWNSAGNPHSWIVLEQATGSTIGAGNPQILIDLKLGDSYQGYIKASTSGSFSGGNTLNAPTATDEIEITPHIDYYNIHYLLNPGNQTSRLHVIGSEDGQNLYVITCVAGVAFSFWGFCKAKNAVANNWPHPWFAIQDLEQDVYATGTAKIPTTNRIACSSYIGSSSVTLYLISENIFKPGLTTRSPVHETNATDNDSGGYPFCALGIMSQTAPHSGRKGAISDLYLGLRSNSAGDTYSDALGVKRWAQFGDFIVPWPDVIPETT